MWKAKVFTLYPEFFPGPLGASLYKKAQDNKLWSLEVINIRDYATDKHSSVDDTPYGGGNGMLIRPDVLAMALDKNIIYGNHRYSTRRNCIGLFKNLNFCTNKEKNQFN